MNNIIHPGAGILFMKVGTHAKETLEDIIIRKTKEIEDAGFALWGYGGNTCHPQTMVQPFAKAYEEKGESIFLCMEEMTSNHFAEPLRADQYSEDGITWKPIPAGINVLGSRYALAIQALHRTKLMLPLAQTRVAIGSSQGRSGENYIKGRVDKACFEITKTPSEKDAAKSRTLELHLTAKLVSPYAVYLRNRA
jgi:hypothetical protein